MGHTKRGLCILNRDGVADHVCILPNPNKHKQNAYTSMDPSLPSPSTRLYIFNLLSFLPLHLLSSYTNSRDRNHPHHAPHHTHPPLSSPRHLNQHLPLPKTSSLVFSPSTTLLTTFVASLKSGKRMCLMPSLLQYAARSLSPPGFSLTKRMSACFAADMSVRRGVSSGEKRGAKSGRSARPGNQGGMQRQRRGRGKTHRRRRHRRRTT